VVTDTGAAAPPCGVEDDHDADDVVGADTDDDAPVAAGNVTGAAAAVDVRAADDAVAVDAAVSGTLGATIAMNFSNQAP